MSDCEDKGTARRRTSKPFPLSTPEFMKNTLSAVVFTLVAANCTSSMAEGFSCERIKDKPVREACIKDRDTKALAEKEEKAKVAMAQKAQEAEQAAAAKELEEKNRATAEFVNSSKQLIAQNLKDPDSAKFTNLVLVQNDQAKLLCGSVNAKNSYGGYVGAKKFYVKWSNSQADTPTVYTEGDTAARANARMNELMAQSRSAGLSEKIRLAQEGDRVAAQARLDLAQSSKVLAEECTGPSSATIADAR